jgi:Putative lumazine-binding
MKNFLFLMTLIGLTAQTACSQQPQKAESEPAKTATATIDPAVEQVVKTFVRGGDTRDVALLESVLHPEHRVTINQFMGGDGVTALNREVYLGMIREGKIGGQPRTFSITGFQTLGHTAQAQVHMESAQLSFDNFLSFVQDKTGKWWLINDAATAKPK